MVLHLLETRWIEECGAIFLFVTCLQTVENGKIKQLPLR